MWLCQGGGGGLIAGVALLGAGAWAANEFGFINWKKAAGNLPLPAVLVSDGWLHQQQDQQRASPRLSSEIVVKPGDWQWRGV